MSLNEAQLAELRALLLARRADIEVQMVQNHENLLPPQINAGSVSQDESARLKNQTREVDQVLTQLDKLDLARIDRALEAMDEGEYGFCDACGCDIPFERLKVEPMTQHCVGCKSKREQAEAAARR